MKFSTILSTTALIAGALAIPTPNDKAARTANRLAARSARRSGLNQRVSHTEDATTDANSSTDVEYSTNWSGAILVSPPSGETFQTVVGTFTVPTPTVPDSSSTSSSVNNSFSGPGGRGSGFKKRQSGAGGAGGYGSPGGGYGSGSGSGSGSSGSGSSGYGSGSGSGSSSTSYSASAWVGIDGDTYSAAILQAGVDFTVDSSGDVTYDSWYEWYPDYAYDFDNFTISAGDSITITIDATSDSEGTVTLENNTTGDQVSKTLSAPDSSSNLGGENAEWIVEDYEEGDSLVSLCDFGTVVFSNSSATTDSGTSVGLTDAEIIDIEQDTVLTSVTINSDSEVTIEYIG